MARNTSKAYETSQEVFPQRLRTLMEETGTNQAQLAEAIGGVKRQTVSLYVQGQSSPDWKKLKAIAEYFDVSCDWLLGLSEIRSANADIKATCELTGLSECSINSILGMLPGKKTVLNACLEKREFRYLLSELMSTVDAANELFSYIVRADDVSDYYEADAAFNTIDQWLKEYCFARFEASEALNTLLDAICGIKQLKRSAEDKLDYLSRILPELEAIADDEMRENNGKDSSEE